MILNQSPDNIAIVSNVSDIGEFAIKNSSKAFKILSDGLYANKIRAVVRELGCNALDSHVAAGKPTLPFDVHLPSSFEPYFSIRDYGVGLTHQEVVNIYTTYFESTKTHSNDFIGALGLGSKSPFSYTENFTVTAVKNGVKGIYTAFINDRGVPSIALMTSDTTTDPNGVEVKFAVENSYDFAKFEQEALSVFRYFSTKPVITGRQVEIDDVEYAEKDIIPGVHITNSSGYRRGYYGHRGSYAVMGNIQYPIDVPNADKNLGGLANLLSMDLEIHFPNGSLEFQASREGLSYNAQTIHAIKERLQRLQDSLDVKFAQDIEKYDNIWERTEYTLKKLGASAIWRQSAQLYTSKNPGKLLIDGYFYAKDIELDIETVKDKFNISMQFFRVNGNTTSDITAFSRKNNELYYEFKPSSGIVFIKSDKPKGYLARAKYHYTSIYKSGNHDVPDKVMILNAADESKPVDYQGFLDFIYNPPASQVIEAATLSKKPVQPRVAKTKTTVAIFSLKNSGRRTERDMVWREENMLSAMPDTRIYPYIPLKGLTSDDPEVKDPKELESLVYNSGIQSLKNFKLYGVRKSDLAEVQSLPNWVPVMDYLKSVISNLNRKELYMQRYAVNSYTYPPIYAMDPAMIVDPDSPYKDYCVVKKSEHSVRGELYSFNKLMKRLSVEIDEKAIDAEAKIYYRSIIEKYPLLKYLSSKRSDSFEQELANYINLIDSHKGE